MAKQNNDRTTFDLFNAEKRVGRPKTNPLERKEQLKINKRNQVRRDRNAGIKRIELKVGTELFDSLNALAANHGMSRSDLIESVLLEHLAQDSTSSHQRETR